MAQDQVAAHPFTTQIEITIFEACVLVRQVVLSADHEGQSHCRVEHFDGFGNDLHFSRLHFGVLHACRPLLDGAYDLEHPFHTDVCHLVKSLFGKVGIDGHLNDAVAVAHIEKDDATMVAATMHPARKRHLLVGVGGSQFATGMSFVHSAPPNCFYHEGHDTCTRFA